MIKDVFINLVYLFYPKKICSRTEENRYNNSPEYERLDETINYFKNNSDIYIKIEKEFENDSILKNMKNFSRLDWQDRTINYELQIIENDELYTLSLLMSILIPFYTIRIQKNKIEFFFSNSDIAQIKKENFDSRKLKDLVIDISNIVENKMLYKRFPLQLMNSIIEDVSFQDISLGRFTMFNAFFNNLINNETEYL